MYKTYFNYGAMSSGKTLQLLSAIINYRMKNANVLIMSPQQDNRAGVGVIKTRVEGMKPIKVDFVISEFNDKLKAFLHKAYDKNAIIFIDECQFISYNTVKQMVNYCRDLEDTHNHKSPYFKIMAYGLLTDFNNKLFEGTRAWLEEADSMRQLKSSCAVENCDNNPTCNILNPDIAAKARAEGTNTVIGSKAYMSVCSYHYYALMKKYGL